MRNTKRARRKSIRFYGFTNKELENRIRHLATSSRRYSSLGGRTPLEEYQRVTEALKMPQTLGIKLSDIGTGKKAKELYRKELIKMYDILAGRYRKEYFKEARNSLARALQSMGASSEMVKWVSRNVKKSDMEEYSEAFGYLKSMLYSYKDIYKGRESDFVREVAIRLMEKLGVMDKYGEIKDIEKWQKYFKKWKID